MKNVRPKENDEQVRTTLRIRQSLFARMQHRAIDERISQQELLERALTLYLSQKGARS